MKERNIVIYSSHEVHHLAFDGEKCQLHKIWKQCLFQ